MDSLLEKLLLMGEKDLLPCLEQLAVPGSISGNGYWYRPGTGKILLQAHTDTVRKKTPVKLYEKYGVVHAGGEILGADDRAGVYALVQFLDDKEVSLLCTDEEEIGGNGMKSFLKAHKKFPGINLAIALDRQGSGEYVVYDSNPEAVHDYINEFGFCEQDGTFSDIHIFTGATNIPAVNLSVGYYNQHTTTEYLCLDALEMTIARLHKIVANPISKLYKAKPYTVWPDRHTSRYGSFYHYAHGTEIISAKDDDDEEEGWYQCQHCGEWTSEVDKAGMSLCFDCKMYLQEAQATGNWH
jgi:hypothetical protein